MKVDIGRKIDYWLGIPICFFLTIIETIKKIFLLSGIKEIAPKRIMFLGLSEMGSAILAYPAIKRAKEIYPQAQFYFWIFKEIQDSIRTLNIIPEKNIIAMNSKNFYLIFIDVFRNLYRIRKERIDTVIDIELFSRFSSILVYLSGARIRVGFYKYKLEGLYRGDLHTHKIMFNPHMHISKFFFGLVQSLKAKLEDRPLLREPLIDYKNELPNIKSSNEDEQNIWSKLKRENNQISQDYKLIILNPDLKSRLPLRRWPQEHYLELAKKLLINPDVFVIVIGLGYRKLSLGIESERYIDLVDKTTVKQLIDLFNISTLLISHDSGIVHLASLTNINTIVMFGPETPILYGPLTNKKEILYANFICSPCFSVFNHRLSDCKDNKCVQAITVDDVLGTAKRYLYRSEKEVIYLKI